MRHTRALLNADELGVCTEGESGNAEDVVTDRELADSGANSNDLPGELAAQDPLPRPADAKYQAAEEGDGRPATLVGFAGRSVQPVHRRRVDFDQDFLLLGYRLLDLVESLHVRRPIPVVDNRSHVARLIR